ncbi:hypothetical protein TNCV_5077021 [Trichonephila clavipes]|uniref:Uncharacterized protein n=1 Tax=Trichonephila clavipes TaxID=2585209 RepID=A0A8X6VCM1_TRICX|nr:hypothetical protein TNCV_5077021 [Trichonephila clavipes]
MIVLGAIGYMSRSPLVRIDGSLNSVRYISNVVRPVIRVLRNPIFKQDNARPHVLRTYLDSENIPSNTAFPFHMGRSPAGKFNFQLEKQTSYKNGTDPQLCLESLQLSRFFLPELRIPESPMRMFPKA